MWVLPMLPPQVQLPEVLNREERVKLDKAAEELGGRLVPLLNNLDGAKSIDLAFSCEGFENLTGVR